MSKTVHSMRIHPRRTDGLGVDDQFRQALRQGLSVFC